MKIETINIPSILYKYRDWNNPIHKTILTDCALYFASPQTFEDLKDCRIPKVYISHPRLHEFFLKKSKKDYPAYKKRFHKKRAKLLMEQSPLYSQQNMKSTVEMINKEFHNRFGVLSMTSNSHNDDMWEKYANNHHGLCVGFYTNKLKPFIRSGGEVIYVDNLPTIDFLKDNYLLQHAKTILFKEREWEFEQEYRLLMIWNDTATTEQRTMRLPNDSIAEIILGKLMSVENKEEIKKIAMEKYPNAKIIELTNSNIDTN